MAIFVDLVRQILALRYREALPREEVRLTSEEANAVDLMTLGFRKQRLYQESAAPQPLRPRSDRDGTNFCEMRSIEMQGAAANDAALFFEHDKIADVLADFR